MTVSSKEKMVSKSNVPPGWKAEKVRGDGNEIRGSSKRDDTGKKHNPRGWERR